MTKPRITKIRPHVVDHGYRKRVLNPFWSVRNYTLLRARKFQQRRLSKK